MSISYLQQVLKTSLGSLGALPAGVEAHALASQLLGKLDELNPQGDIHDDRRMAQAEYEKARREASAASRRLMELRTPSLLNTEASLGRAQQKLSAAHDVLMRAKKIERAKRPRKDELISQAKALGIVGCSRMRVNKIIDAVDARAGNETPPVAARRALTAETKADAQSVSEGSVVLLFRKRRGGDRRSAPGGQA